MSSHGRGRSDPKLVSSSEPTTSARTGPQGSELARCDGAVPEDEVTDDEVTDDEVTDDLATPLEMSTSDSWLDSVMRAVGEIVEKVAFPLALDLIVLAFLSLQHHIDRRDPELAGAPRSADPPLEYEES